MRLLKVLCAVGVCFLSNVGFINVYASSAVNTAKTSISFEQAQKFIADLGKKALGIINRKGITEKEVSSEFKTLLNDNLALERVAATIFGRDFKTYSEKKKNVLKECLLNMLVTAYVSGFNEYKKAIFTVIKAAEKSKTQILVTSKISVPGKKDVIVGWIIDKSSSKINDVTIENLSICHIQRMAAKDLISVSGIDAFIKKWGEHEAAQ